MFRRFGSRVTIVQFGAQLLGREDSDVAHAVAAILEQDGIEILLNASASHVTRIESQIHLTVRMGTDVVERKFLGFSFTAGPEVKRTIAPQALDRFKARVRAITRRAKGVSIETTIAALAPYMLGWRSYFGFCETPEALLYLTRWVRLRLRAALWRQWKTPRRRRAALLALGVPPPLASNTAGSGRGPWRLARTRALSAGLSNAYFKSLGLPTLIDGC
jgi:group II intron maturase/pyridine nucleotide-disulfide oxidoreductase